MNKIFILTGEPSGDKLASEVIKKIKLTKTDIDYLSVGGQYLSSIGIRSIFDQKKNHIYGFYRYIFKYI